MLNQITVLHRLHGVFLQLLVPCSRPPWKSRRVASQCVLLLLLVGYSPVARAQQAFYVSPDGNDSSLGTVAVPFRTLERAKSAVRASTTGMSGDIRVFLRDGMYPLANTFALDARDSGRNGYSVIYESFPGERATLSGGQTITGWTAFGNGIFRASVGALRFRQLYVNGARAVRARTPNSGDFHLLRAWDTGGRRLEISRDEISQWGALGEVELIVLGKGVNQANLRIASFLPSGTSAFIIPKEPERTRIFQQVYPPKEQRPFYFENAFEFLDRPGEWYLDTGAGQLYYFPRPGEDMTTSVVVAPVLERLVEVKGTLAAPVTRLTFRGLTFEHATWLSPNNEGFIGDQASTEFVAPLPADQISSYPSRPLPGAIHVEAANHVVFERNTFRHLGASALNFFMGVTDSEVIGNLVDDVSGSGISIDLNLQGNPTDQRRICKRIAIRNNYLRATGRDFIQSVGIMAGYTEAAVIEHNELHDMPYSGITLGWGWANVDNAARNNIVRYNELSDVMKTSADGAGIYTLSKQPGSLIAENYVHDLVRSPWHGGFVIAGIYLDEGSNLITVRDNVLLNTGDTQIFQNANGPGNVFQNNDGSSPSIIDNAGLDPAFEDIRPPLPPQPGPLALAFAFDEGIGTVSSDSSGNMRSASLQNGAAWASGKFGNAVLLDGQNDYVMVLNPGLPTLDFTWSAWVYVSQLKSFQTIMEAQGSSAAELEINLLASGSLELWARGSSLLTTHSTLSANAWHHVAVLRSGSAIHVYINGQEDAASGTVSTALSFGSCPLLLGVDADAGCTGSLNGYLAGRLDDVRIYSRALSADEIQRDMSQGLSGVQPDSLPPAAPTHLTTRP